MVEQLGPLDRNLAQFGDKLQLLYYPYGNSDRIGDNKWNCTNGDNQCTGNAVHVSYSL